MCEGRVPSMFHVFRRIIPVFHTYLRLISELFGPLGRNKPALRHLQYLFSDVRNSDSFFFWAVHTRSAMVDVLSDLCRLPRELFRRISFCRHVW